MFLDASLVLKQLQRTKGQSQLLYTFIFLQSWKHLSETAQVVLAYVGKTVSTTISWQELVDEQFAEEEDLQEAIRQLLTYSLLDISSGDQIQYGIHQLTRQFVTSDLPRLGGLT
jgi:drug/metabolite transporter superfamily protein YnfA